MVEEEEAFCLAWPFSAADARDTGRGGRGESVRRGRRVGGEGERKVKKKGGRRGGRGRERLQNSLSSWIRHAPRIQFVTNSRLSLKCRV